MCRAAQVSRVNVCALDELLMLPVILFVSLELVLNALPCVASQDTPQRRILHRSKLVHGSGTLVRVSDLRTIALAHRLFRVDVVVGAVTLAELHRSSSPVGSESARFNALHFYGPFRTKLLADGFCETLNRPFARAIDAERGNATLSADARNLLDQAALGLVDIPHDLKACASNVDQALEILISLQMTCFPA